MSPTPKTDDSAQPEARDDEYRAALVKEARDYALRTPDVLAARAINTLATEIERMSLAEGE